MFESMQVGRFLRISTSVRAVLVLSVVMVLATVLAASILLLDLRQREIAHAKGETVSLSGVLSEQTTRTFEGVMLTMRAARERLSDDVGRQLPLDSYPIQLLLKARIAGLPQVKSLFLADAQGRNVNSSRPDFIRDLPLVEREFFRYFAAGGQDEIFISRPERAKVDGQPAFYISMRLAGPEGEFRGVLVAAITIPYFESLYGGIGLDYVSRISLLKADGTLLAGTPTDPESLGKKLGNEEVLAALREAPGEQGVVVSEHSPTGRWFAAYRQVDRFPLVISAAVNEDEALAPWRRVALPIAMGVAVILFFVLITSFFMMRNLRRKEALESALKDSDEQLRHMVQSVRDAIVTIDSNKQIVLFNSAAERIFGVSAEAAIGCDVGEFLSGCLRQAQCINLMRYFEEGWRAPSGLVLLGIIELQRDGQEIPVELSLSSTIFRGQTLLTTVFRDLTERQRAERELLETNRQLQELSASLQNVREEERTRIARELHDELGQSLTGIRMEVSWLGGRLLPEQEVLQNKVKSIKSLIDQTISAVRRISSELRPLVLDDLGFAAAASWYVDQFSARTGLSVLLFLPEADPAQGGAVATALFRVLQESLTNVARHAGATKIEVRLDLRDGNWVMFINDDGQGFAPDSGKHRGLGLVGMRERVQALGGHINVRTAPEQGTVIEVLIPAEKERGGDDGEI